MSEIETIAVNLSIREKTDLKARYFYCNRFTEGSSDSLVSEPVRRGGNVPVALYQW